MNDNSYKVLDVDINEILPNRFQPRIQFDEEEILELSDSIKEHGVIQPIVVRTIGDKYEIIAGERRYKASVLAGKDTVPVIIKNLNDRDSAELALIENVQRKNLTPIEEALSYKKILDMGYLTQENLAIKIGKSQSSVANKIRLLNLSDEVQEALLDNKISERHARSLLRLKSNVEQNKILEKIITQRLTVRKTDQEIDELLNENNIKEKEEENIMMENIQETNNIKIQSNAPFDIFGGQSTSETVPEVATMPIIEPTIPEVPVVEASPVTGIQFDANGNVIAAPTTMTQVPEVATMPIIEPTIPEVPVVEASPVTEIQFDANGNVIAAPTTMTQVPEVATMPIIEPTIPEVQVVEASPVTGIQFDANGNVIAAPTTMTQVPEMATMPIIEPTIPEVQVVEASPVTGIQFDANGNVIAAPTTMTQVPEVATMPIIEPTIPEVPVVEASPVTGIQFDANGNVIAAPTTMTQVPEMATMPIIEPIIDSFDFNKETEIKDSNISEMISEPIIITDYDKQYDPIMPNAPIELPDEKIDFKEVISAIRECSNKIEKYGYKIELEEYDLSTLYQVVFKIEK